MTLRSVFEDKMQFATERDTKNDHLIVKAIDRLEAEGSHLLGTGRHGWVRSTANCLNSPNNWGGYAMSVHIAFQLETNGISCVGEKCLIPGEATDVDIAFEHQNGIDVAIECVATQEPANFWGPEEEDSEVTGLMMRVISAEGGDNEKNARRVQHKLRVKTIKAEKDSDGSTVYTVPVKFPSPGKNSLHIIAVDLTLGLGLQPDVLDMRALAFGNSGMPGSAYERMLGLFEQANPHGDEFGEEFRGNRYLRERVHGMLFLIDRSTLQCSLDPHYDGMLIMNTLLSLDDQQTAARDGLGVALTGLVGNWFTGEVNYQ